MRPHTETRQSRELRGGVYSYCEAARRWLAPGGRFCFVMLAQDPRTEDAVHVHGLRILERWDYVFKEGRPPHICTLVCARAEDVPAGTEARHGTMIIRGEDGHFTQDHRDFKSYMLHTSGASLRSA